MVSTRPQLKQDPQLQVRVEKVSMIVVAERGPTQWGMERSEHPMERSGIQSVYELQLQ